MPRYPFSISPTVWYYEMEGGIDLVHEIRTGGGYVRTDIIRISKRRLKAYITRVKAIEVRRLPRKRGGK